MIEYRQISSKAALTIFYHINTHSFKKRFHTKAVVIDSSSAPGVDLDVISLLRDHCKHSPSID